MKGQKKKTKLARHFSEARTMVGKTSTPPIPRGNATIIVNTAIYWTFGASGHLAIERIRKALQSISGATGGKMTTEVIDNARSAGIERAIELEVIYNEWSKTLIREGHLKARDATQDFAKGYGIADIERRAKVRRGHGTGQQLIIQGIGAYLKAQQECEVLISKLDA